MGKFIDSIKSGKVSRANRSKMIMGIGASILLAQSASASASAATVDGGSFDNFYDAMVSWVQGSLGYVIALLGMLGTIIVYAFTHKGAVLFMGMLLSFFVGGVVGISKTMFTIGTGTFATT